MGKRCDTLKTKFLKAREICSRKIKTKELCVNNTPINSSTLSQITARDPLETVDIPKPTETLNRQIQFTETYGVRAIEQILQQGIVISEDHRYPLQTANVKLEIPNDINKLIRVSLTTAIGYTTDAGNGAKNLVLYNPTTRNWDENPSSVEPYLITSVSWNGGSDKNVNINSYVTITNQEIFDIFARQLMLVPGGNLLPPPTGNSYVTYYIFVEGELEEGPFEPLITTQYSTTYVHSWAYQQ